jgi:hypothetical protein
MSHKIVLENTGKQVCLWKEDDEGNWDTSCNEKFIILAQTPKENGMVYCPYCGREIKEQ